MDKILGFALVWSVGFVFLISFFFFLFSSFYVRSGNEPPIFPENLVNLNCDQKRIMSACASMCSTNLTTPQAAIIQGPPGTGKNRFYLRVTRFARLQFVYTSMFLYCRQIHYRSCHGPSNHFSLEKM